MSDSLVIAGIIELLGRVPSQQPQCPGAVFTLGPGYDLSSPQTESEYVANLLGDGQRLAGFRANNRTITLPVVITAPDRATLAAAAELLLSTIAQPQWTLTWTRDGGKPGVLDCTYAMPADVTHDLRNHAQLVQRLSIVFQTMPYLRTDDLASIVVATNVTPAAVELDNYESVAASGWSQSAAHVLDSHSARWDGTGPGGANPVYAAAIPATDMTGRAALTAWIGLGTDAVSYRQWSGGLVTFAVVLADGTTGARVSLGTTVQCAASESRDTPTWQRLVIPLPDDAAFDWSNVVAYEFQAWAALQAGQPALAPDLYLNALTASPAWGAQSLSARALLAEIAGISGTAHAPVGVELSQRGSWATQTFTTPGAGTATIPAGVTALRRQLWGGGGPGQSLAAPGQGTGGSGGCYSEDPAYPVTPGTYNLYVGDASGGANGASKFDDLGSGTWQGIADHGVAGAAGAPGVAALGATTGPIRYKGGDGAAAVTAPAASRRQISPAVSYSGSDPQITLPGVTAQGSCVVVWVGSDNTSGQTPPSVSSVSWASGHADNWQQAVSYYRSGWSLRLTAWICRNCRAGEQVIAVDTSSGAFMLRAEEFVGVDPNPLDKTHAASDYGSAWDSGSTTTSTASELWSGCAWAENDDSDATLGGPGGWTNETEAAHRFSNDGMYFLTGYRTVSSTGSLIYSGTSHSGTYVLAGVLSLKLATVASGGGGSSAGVASAGNPAIGVAGGIAPTGGTKGGDGRTTAGAGGNGTQPGSGGAGALSTSGAQSGGTAGAGKIVLTYRPATLTAFSSWLLHIPGRDAPAALVPAVSVGAGADTPNGSTEYPVPAAASGVPARFGGTYTVLAVASSLSSPSSSRTVTIKIRQYSSSGVLLGDVTVARTFTPDTASSDLVSGRNGYVALGTVALPNWQINPDNTEAYHTVTVTDTITADRFLDVLFLDVAGQTVLYNDSAATFTTFYLDVPDSTRDLGPLTASTAGRSRAASVSAAANLSGGPLYVEPGRNMLLAYNPTAAPDLTVTYRPQFWLDRV